MRSIGVVCVLMLLGASEAGATEIAGKWGIGAAAFSGGGEVSLIRGRSARSAWLFDVSIKQQSDDTNLESSAAPGETVNRNILTVFAGPGYRRFTRPDDAFSPYWDVRVRGSYAHSRENRSATDRVIEQTVSGVEGDFSFGLEYFTRWHFSLAAHTGLASVAWIHSTLEDVSPFSTFKLTDDSVQSGISLNPVVYVRAYF